MQLVWSDADEDFRADLRAFLDANAPPEAVGGAQRDPDGPVIPGWARQWQARLFDHGWMVPGFPPELGGRNATPVQTLIYLEELARRRIPRSLHMPGYAIVAPSLLEFGSEALKQLAPAAIRGDTIWCLGMSEPNAGSDLAALSTKAVRDGDRFVVNGQKVWTSYAMVADRCFCYARTDPDAPKHRGISVLIIDMDTPGVDVRPLRHLTGAAHFAEVFLTDVEVPEANLVGGLNDGWRITMGSLAHERGGLWIQTVTQVQQELDELCVLARKQGLDRDGAVRRQLARAYERVASLRALGYKGFASFAQGSSAPEHSLLKLAASELDKELHELGMALEGPFGATTGRWTNGLLVSFASTIAAGTSEIQRNIIATRVLGLPR
ncbi:MAG: acyl-CoA dehydrogenase family protein [Acidimicrobiales bacterium]